jgi:hypothetical protein
MTDDVNTGTSSESPNETVKTLDASETVKKTEEAPKQTTSKIVEKYKIPDVEFKPKPSQTETKTETRFIPNPETDPEGYAKYVESQEVARGRDMSSLRDLTLKTQEQLESLSRNAQRQALDQDVKAAVESVNKVVKASPMLIEAALNLRVDTDPAFERIWLNRYKAPEAYKEALEVIANELKDEFAVRIDQKTSDDVAAMKKATAGTSTTSSQDSETDKLLNLPPEKFLNTVRRMMEG